jgi:hypothetical protein
MDSAVGEEKKKRSKVLDLLLLVVQASLLLQLPRQRSGWSTNTTSALDGCLRRVLP